MGKSKLNFGFIIMKAAALNVCIQEIWPHIKMFIYVLWIPVISLISKFICYVLKPTYYRKIITKLKLNVLISTTLQSIIFHRRFFWQIRCNTLRQKEIWAMDTLNTFCCMYCCFKKHQQNLSWYLIQHPKKSFVEEILFSLNPRYFYK